MKPILMAALAASTTLLSCQNTKENQELAIIPEPISIRQGNGTFSFNDQTQIEFDKSNPALASIAANLPAASSKGSANKIVLAIDTTITGDEAYRLKADAGQITISARTDAGLFYGVQTLTQMLPEVPAVEIEDAPRFEWRGMMLDVSRHYQPKAYIKEFIDMLAFHKINRFHWHLTDGIGWRIQIDRYPELTSKGAFRKVKEAKAPWIGLELADSQTGENVYGGYYTKDDIREVVAYAASKYIEVIPEIEMPGHSESATFVYPEYICQGAKPGSGIYCAGNEKTYEFLQNVLEEVVELFPSQYIHIGGDEVGKEQWAQCPACKKLKANKGLKDEHEVQSYFVKRMESFINSKGKRLIGWDEILEGGLAESATVMSWTGWEGGIKAANAQHDVIMMPLDYVYFDHYQGYNPFEPQAWGGYNSLRRVYDFPVVPEGIKPENVKYVKGGQANMWTENVRDTAHLEYMLFPRMAALSEALWSAHKDWDKFKSKMDVQFDRYAANGWNYAESAITPMVDTQESQEDKSIITLKTELDYPVYYTLDNSEPTVNSPRYEGQIVIDRPATLKAQAFRRGKPVGYPLTLANLRNKATGAKVTYATPCNAQYNGGGDSALVDNRFAIHRGDDKAWQGFEKADMDLTIELKETQPISMVNIRFFQHSAITSVLLPESVRIEVSTDGKEFSRVYEGIIEADGNVDGFVKNYPFDFPEQEARYVRIFAKNRGTLPAGHRLAGGNAWIFTDEIAIR